MSDRPPARTYWRGLEELADTPEFRAFVQREFPGYANVFEGSGEAEGEGIDRRRALQLMGASLALAGLAGAGCRRPNLELVPFARQPEEVIPGLPTYYATTIPRPEAPFPVIVESHEGRPTKIEGNPKHPLCRVELDKAEDPDGRFTRGGTDLFAQASILDLYNPDRGGALKQGTEERTWAEFDLASDTYFTKFLKGEENSGEGLHFLTEDVNSPALKLVRDFLKTKAPKATWHTYDPLRRESVREGARLAFGKPVSVSYRLDRADVILALDSDFLGCDECAAPHARDFARRRKVETPADADRMNRLYVVESTYSVTGAAADHRLRLPGSLIADYAAALAHEVLSQLRAAGNPPRESGVAIDALASRSSMPSVPEKWLKAVAADLVRARGKGVVLASYRQPVPIHLLAHLLNEALDNHSAENKPRTVEFRSSPARGLAPFDDLIAALKAGKVDTLVIIGSNPAYDAPADSDFARLLAKAPFRIRLGLTYDETAHACCTVEGGTGWYLPMTHYLEEWGDAESADGTYSPVQPLIQPLHGARSALEVVARLARHPKPVPYELVQQSFRQRIGQSDENPAPFRRFLHEGWWPGSTRKPEAQAFAWSEGTRRIVTKPSSAEPLNRERLEITFHPDGRLLDGRYASNAWLQELPDPITKLTWDNALLVSPRMARELDIKTQDLVEVSLNGVTVPVAVFVLPGQADWSLAVTLGGGRERVGRLATAGERLGFNVYPLRTSAAPHFAVGVTITKSGQTYALASTQLHGALESRDIVHTYDTERFQRHAKHRPKGETIPLPLRSPDLSAVNPDLDQSQGWGMVIDLNACTACNACVVACQAENNVPVVGKGEVVRGREMHWLRIDRYFTDPDAGTRDLPDADLHERHQTPADVENPGVAHQLMLCVHCEQAPCELVCPVNAAVHSPEGLNLQVYNRCIGTRYCANNCPWKVRRFNWFDYNERPLDQLRLGPLTEKGMPETLKMQKNPDVTIRMRGVMEKCTYCVQRIERGKTGTKLMRLKEGSTDFTVPDGVITPACAQACPSGAIVFGNVKNPGSRVARMKRQNPRDYQVLGELNTKPRTSYLARVRNLNRAMRDTLPSEGHS